MMPVPLPGNPGLPGGGANPITHSSSVAARCEDMQTIRGEMSQINAREYGGAANHMSSSSRSPDVGGKEVCTQLRRNILTLKNQNQSLDW